MLQASCNDNPSTAAQLLCAHFSPCVQTERGIGQATKAGQRIREVLEADGAPYRMFFYTSPYKRSHQTYEAVASCFQVRPQLVGEKGTQNWDNGL